MDDREFRQLLTFLQRSWPGYRKVRKGVKKRIGRHMRDLGCSNMQLYLERLSRDGEARRQCELLMSVSISRFFRDRKLWEILEDHVLPDLVDICGDRLRAWSVGCACGEEVYSLKIIWEHIRPKYPDLPELEITATDLNPQVLVRASDGIYPRSSLKEVPENLVATYFDIKKGGKQFRVKDRLRPGIEWIEQDLFTGPPGSGFHMIFVRNNLLTYFQDERTQPVFMGILDALTEGGYLLVGSHEAIPTEFPSLQQFTSLPYVYKKQDYIAGKI